LQTATSIKWEQQRPRAKPRLGVNQNSGPSTRQIDLCPNRRPGEYRASTRQIDPCPNRRRWECRRAAIPPTRQIDPCPNRRRWECRRAAIPPTRQIDPPNRSRRECRQAAIPATRQVKPDPNRGPRECRQAAILPTRQVNRVPKSRLPGFNSTGVFREATNGLVQIIRFSAVTDLSGTIEIGGEAITRASFSVSAAGT